MFSNTAESVNRRMGYCNDLMGVISQKERNQEFFATGKPLIKLKRKQATLRALVMGNPVPRADEVITSESQSVAQCNELLAQFHAESDESSKIGKLLELQNYIAVQFYAWRTDHTASRTFPLNDQELEVKKLVDENASKINEVNKEIAFKSRIRAAFDINKGNVLAAKEKQLNQEYDAKRRQIFDDYIFPENNRILGVKKALRAELNENLAKVLNDQEAMALQSEFLEKSDALSDEFSAFKKSVLGNMEVEHAASVQAVKDEKEAMAQAVRDAVIAQSSVTQEDAQKWLSEKATITKAVRNKCKKKGITPEQLEQTIKDFYVITNGRLGKIKIDTKNHDRAYASKIQNHAEEGFVMLDNDFSLAVLWHELAHHLESDDSMRVLAQNYIKSRSLDGGAVHKLKDLTNNKNYRATEKAYKTDMFSHYAAKVYDSGETELFAMSVEALYSNKKLFETMLQDPVTLEYATAALMQPKSATTELNKGMRDYIIENDVGAENAILANAEATFNQLAKLVTWESANFEMSDLPSDDSRILRTWFKAKPFARLTLPDGTIMALLESSAVKLSYQGRGMKGVIGLNWSQFENKFKGLDLSEFFTMGGVMLNRELTFPIQTQSVEKIKVMALAMHTFGRVYSASNTKGEVGADYLTYDRLEILKTKFLSGGNA